MCEGLGPGESLDLVTRMSGEYSAVRLGELHDGQVMLDLSTFLDVVLRIMGIHERI